MQRQISGGRHTLECTETKTMKGEETDDKLNSKDEFFYYISSVEQN